MSDPRFARLKTDPRFRRPKTKQQKVVIDERFKSVFSQSKRQKGKAAGQRRVDKYGRKLSQTHDEDNLKKYYRLAHRSEDDEDEAHAQSPETMDYARGQILMESSDEEDVQDEEIADDSDQSDIDEVVKTGVNEDEPEIDLDEDTFAELDAQVKAYARANEESKEQEDVGVANRTRRFAVVNLDWDHVRASHLYKIFSSLVSLAAPQIPVSATSVNEEGRDGKKRSSRVARGAVLSVKVYPSEFGKARMEQEEREGPPAEIFKERRKGPEEINERTIFEVGDENDYDEDALRRYQLERLRYYYAIVECDTVEAASHIYNELEGTELERSANVFNLSFVPDDMAFESDPRDEATDNASTGYRPIDYVTDALRHSKVKLTWDEDDPERYQITRRQLTRQEIEDADFRAYIASSSSEEEGDRDNNISMGRTKREKDSSRRNMRALLLGGNDDTLPEGWSNDGDGNGVDMEITFTPGLTESKGEEDTTLEKYQKKIREKRKKRKDALKQSKKSDEGREEGRSVEADDFFDYESSDHADHKSRSKNETKNMPATSSRAESTADQLAFITTSQEIDEREPKHFNMKAILKAEKRGGKKGKRGKQKQEEGELQEDFSINVRDERFKVLHEDHLFAIDPTNPHFKKTKGMKAMLDERHRRQKELHDRDFAADFHTQMGNGSDQGLQNLVESVKRKSQESHGKGKRRRT